MANAPIIDNSVYIYTRDKKIKALAKMVRQKKDLQTIYEEGQNPPDWADKSIDNVVSILCMDLRENEKWKTAEEIRLSGGGK